jgi:hypothetical protein
MKRLRIDTEVTGFVTVGSFIDAGRRVGVAWFRGVTVQAARDSRGTARDRLAGFYPT